jgi:non-homologous end joining protein Ku
MPTAACASRALNPSCGRGRIGVFCPESSHAPRHLERRDQLRPRARSVALYPASEESGIDFDWLDKRTHDRSATSASTSAPAGDLGENIVKGIKQANGDYVILSEDEIKEAYPKSTQTIEIEAFVEAAEISFTQLEKPVLHWRRWARAKRSMRCCARRCAKAGVIGIARVVMHTKERWPRSSPTARP